MGGNASTSLGRADHRSLRDMKSMGANDRPTDRYEDTNRKSLFPATKTLLNINIMFYSAQYYFSPDLSGPLFSCTRCKLQYDLIHADITLLQVTASKMSLFPEHKFRNKIVNIHKPWTACHKTSESVVYSLRYTILITGATCISLPYKPTGYSWPTWDRKALKQLQTSRLHCYRFPYIYGSIYSQRKHWFKYSLFQSDCATRHD